MSPDSQSVRIINKPIQMTCRTIRSQGGSSLFRRYRLQLTGNNYIEFNQQNLDNEIIIIQTPRIAAMVPVTTLLPWATSYILNLIISIGNNYSECKGSATASLAMLPMQEEFMSLRNNWTKTEEFLLSLQNTNDHNPC